MRPQPILVINRDYKVAAVLLMPIIITYCVSRSELAEPSILNSTCEKVATANFQSPKSSKKDPSIWSIEQKNKPFEIINDGHEKLKEYPNSLLKSALTNELSEKQKEALTEVPDDFMFLELSESPHWAEDVIIRITNLDPSSDTRKYLISLLKGLPLREKEEAVESLSYSHREEDKLVAIELLSAVDDYVKTKLFNRFISENPSETILSALISFSENDANKQVMPLFSKVISNRFLNEKNEIAKLQLLLIKGFPSQLAKTAFSNVIAALDSDDTGHRRLGYRIAQKWINNSEQNLTSTQLGDLFSSLNSALNNTFLPVEERLTSLRLLRAIESS